MSSMINLIIKIFQSEFQWCEFFCIIVLIIAVISAEGIWMLTIMQGKITVMTISFNCLTPHLHRLFTTPRILGSSENLQKYTRAMLCDDAYPFPHCLSSTLEGAMSILVATFRMQQRRLFGVRGVCTSHLSTHLETCSWVHAPFLNFSLGLLEAALHFQNFSGKLSEKVRVMADSSSAALGKLDVYYIT